LLSSPRTTTTATLGTGRVTHAVDGRVPVAVSAPDPISREGAISQLRRHPEVDLREESGPGTVALLIEDALDEAALTRLRRIVRSEGARAVLVVGAIRETELLDVVECGVGAIVWRHEATAHRLVQAVLAASRGGDFEALLALLDPDVVLHADRFVGPSPAPIVLQGVESVRRGAILASERARASELALVDGAPGLLMVRDGRLAVVLAFQVDGDRITGIEVIADPERLATLELAVL